VVDFLSVVGMLRYQDFPSCERDVVSPAVAPMPAYWAGWSVQSVMRAPSLPVLLLPGKI